MDHDLVVEPAHGGQVLRVAAAAIDPLHDVMGLGAIPAGTARNRARCTVAVQDEAAQLGRDHATAPSHRQWCPVLSTGRDLNDPVTEDRFDRCLADPQPGCNDDAGLPVRRCRVSGVDEHGQHGNGFLHSGTGGVLNRGAVTTGETVEADRPQSVRPVCGP